MWQQNRSPDLRVTFLGNRVARHFPPHLPTIWIAVASVCDGQNHLASYMRRRRALTVAGQWRNLTALPLLLLRYKD